MDAEALDAAYRWGDVLDCVPWFTPEEAAEVGAVGCGGSRSGSADGCSGVVRSFASSGVHAGARGRAAGRQRHRRNFSSKVSLQSLRSESWKIVNDSTTRVISGPHNARGAAWPVRRKGTAFLLRNDGTCAAVLKQAGHFPAASRSPSPHALLQSPPAAAEQGDCEVKTARRDEAPGWVHASLLDAEAPFLSLSSSVTMTPPTRTSTHVVRLTLTARVSWHVMRSCAARHLEA